MNKLPTSFAATGQQDKMKTFVKNFATNQASEVSSTSNVLQWIDGGFDLNNIPHAAIDELRELAEVAQVETLGNQVGVERVRLEGRGDDGEPGWLTAGAHVEDKVLVSDLRQRPHVLQPGGDLLVILRSPAVDDDISVPTTVVDHAAPARAAVDFATELQLRVLYSEVPESQVHHLVCDEGVGEDAVLPPRVINDLTVV